VNRADIMILLFVTMIFLIFLMFYWPVEFLDNDGRPVTVLRTHTIFDADIGHPGLFKPIGTYTEYSDGNWTVRYE